MTYTLLSPLWKIIGAKINFHLKSEKIVLSSDNPTLSGKVPVINDVFFDPGNEIEEIISNKPAVIVRWGTVFFFFLLILIGVICWYIKYPDIVIANSKLNSLNAPKEVIARTDGKLIKIAVKENENVVAGQVLGYVESIADPLSVIKIYKQINSIDSLIGQNKTDDITAFFPNYTTQTSVNNLGELQTPYQTFIQSFIAFKDFLSSGFFLRKKNMLLNDIQNIKKLHGILTKQKSLLNQDLSLSNETFNANESLVKDKVISLLEYRNEKSKLIAKQLSLPQINASIISNESHQIEKRKEIDELENQIIVQKNIFIQALQTIKSQIQAWEFKHLLRAPISGTISYTGFFQENQEIKVGQTVFNIQPANTLYYIEMTIPQYNFGKVKQGQTVLLKFQAYPFEQYGSVVGRINYINSTPTDSGYLASVILPNGLTTNYNKSLLYRNGLLAQADIITKDMRLLERFYYNISKQVKR